MPPLTNRQLLSFERAGYLVVEDVPGLPEVLATVTREHAGVLDRLVSTLRSQGRVSSTYPGLPFGERLAAVRRETGETYSQNFNIALPPDGVGEDTPYWAGPAVFTLLRHEALLDVVESVIGPEVAVTPILHVRLKPPELPELPELPEPPGTARAGLPALASTPPHQDSSGVPPEVDTTRMVTVWLPESDVAEHNGCLRVWPGSHRHGVLPHEIAPGRTAVRREVLDGLGAPVAVPVRAGSLLLMHRRLVHASLPNRSDALRRSFDLRYQPSWQPSVRPFYPGFVARSRSHPRTELHDPAQWRADWQAAKERAVAEGTPPFHRF
ncbi:phytanoyl-CoA dioxygenase family protein [Kitasatospora sp. MAP5-34]|uniref:phytanoyl-CoA dioxygenase family protein n=1 Tax=Kitasatospora sp. MAP5-34 TaxID=3035102 RepID=UPI0024732A31|nr:phytanoyl-CoA dioxygenase family protein [Kitasatospora sp. MAP5-34]MDH6574653.1 phytanoyl-CoA hydroxylase [Kitasatospora sp. MAP5-34]